MFRNDKFPGFENPYNLFEFFKNKDIDSNESLQKRCYTKRSENNRFSTQEAINCIPRTEKGKKVPVCEMSSVSYMSLPFSMLPILSWKLKNIANRDRFRILTSSKLKLFFQ